MTSTPKPWVVFPLVVATSLLVGMGLGRLRGSSSPTVQKANQTTIDRSGGIPLSEGQLERLGLAIIRPEQTRGTDRPMTGFVEPAVGARSEVGMPVTGRVVRLLVAPGASVDAGAVIAAVQSPEAAVVHAQAGSAQATAQSLAYQYRLARPMAQQGALSAQELESRRIASVTASSSARAAMASAMAMGHPDARGGLMIRSPIAGQVTAVMASPGAVLQQGAQLAVISDVRGNELRFLVSPGLAANLTDGQVLRVRAGARELRARVIAVAPDSGRGNRVTVVRARALDTPIPPAGTAVTAFVLVNTAELQVTVPAEAVQIINGTPVVFRYYRGKAKPIPVVIGAQSSGRVVVEQGLGGGETLLTGNTAALRVALNSDPAPP